MEKFLQFFDKIPGLFALSTDYFILLGAAAELFFLVWLHIIFHELGHFAVLSLLCKPPRLVSIGNIDLQLRKSTIFRIAPVPCGFTGDPGKSSRTLQPTPRAQFLVSLGGIGITAVVSITALATAKLAGPGFNVHLALFGTVGVIMILENFFGDNTDSVRVLFALSCFISRKVWPEELPRATRRRPFSLMIAIGIFILRVLVAVAGGITSFLWACFR